MRPIIRTVYLHFVDSKHGTFAEWEDYGDQGPRFITLKDETSIPPDMLIGGVANTRFVTDAYTGREKLYIEYELFITRSVIVRWQCFIIKAYWHLCGKPDVRLALTGAPEIRDK